MDAECRRRLHPVGRPPPPATRKLLQERLESAGFVDVEVFTAKQPFGLWAKDEKLKSWLDGPLNSSGRNRGLCHVAYGRKPHSVAQ
ncbi:Similar to hypothetical protein NECHADRAFT_45631 [Nectria haematococca mpVI 77-13-4]; acc. no. XP_003044406 [Pyronema omphalodes CBS 100304]|uniref:Uncharacterized protein n=1 Tax=Pyronema omphalodes (strain CBS 100304) TaxID=1076935 RepID=U4L259_PYROM|nr:Similar to hypothetical protein NECHADRAFT_45631 [Nectria haematococca mpVI 77-13-4]; acc. no. XP_003044406 [Pyronema omphalodes CBS 100304]